VLLLAGDEKLGRKQPLKCPAGQSRASLGSLDPPSPHS